MMVDDDGPTAAYLTYMCYVCDVYICTIRCVHMIRYEHVMMMHCENTTIRYLKDFDKVGILSNCDIFRKDGNLVISLK